MLNAIRLFFKNYFNFTGRSSRSEYWWFLLAYLIITVVIAILEALIIGIDYAGSGVVSNLFNLVTLIGWLSLTARRLQDRGHTGWWQFAYLIPIIPLIYFGILFLFTENPAHAISAGLVVLLDRNSYNSNYHSLLTT